MTKKWGKVMKLTNVWLAATVLLFYCSVSVFAEGTQEEAAEEKAQAIDDTPSDRDKTTPSQTETITVMDYTGRKVTVTQPVERIAYTHYSTAEALMILDAWDLVVAKDAYPYETEISETGKKIPEISSPMGNPYEPNMELLYKLDPDLLVLDVIPMPGMQELINTLEGDIPVVTVKTYDPLEIPRSFTVLGDLLDRKKEAADFIAWHKGTRKKLSERTKDLSEDEKTRLFFKTGGGDPEDVMTFTDEIPYVLVRNKIVGCINVAGNLPARGGWAAEVDQEWLAVKDIEIMIIGDPQMGRYGPREKDASEIAEHRREVMELPVFSGLAAVKNDRVYMQAEAFTGTPRVLIGFAYLAKWCHPDLFEDLDPRELHQEYYTRFLGADVDLMNQGVFVYPEE